MSQQTWRETLVTQQGAGTLFNTYTTAKSVINTQALYTLYPGFFYIGRKLRILIQAGISNRVTGPDTFTIEVHIGSATAFTTGNIVLTTTAHTTIPLWCEIDLTCRSVGSGTGATLMGQARLTGVMIQQLGTATTDSTTQSCTALYPNTAPAVGAGFDSTISNILDLWSAQSVSNAGNGIQIQQYEVISEN
jgi:hypothetical protein